MPTRIQAKIIQVLEREKIECERIKNEALEALSNAKKDLAEITERLSQAKQEIDFQSTEALTASTSSQLEDKPIKNEVVLMDRKPSEMVKPEYKNEEGKNFTQKEIVLKIFHERPSEIIDNTRLAGMIYDTRSVTELSRARGSIASFLRVNATIMGLKKKKNGAYVWNPEE